MLRRTILFGTVGLAAAYGSALGVGALSTCRRYEVDNPIFASARRIGQRLIASGFNAAPGSENSLAQLQADLPERMRRDFAAGETVSCDGWVLSRSEAEFCVRCARSARDTV